MLSPVRVTRNTERCVSCGVCSQVCPTYIDVMHKQSVSSPECIGCWRCVSHCRFNQALSMRAAGRYAVPGIVFALLVVTGLLGRDAGREGQRSLADLAWISGSTGGCWGAREPVSPDRWIPRHQFTGVDYNHGTSVESVAY